MVPHDRDGPAAVLRPEVDRVPRRRRGSARCSPLPRRRAAAGGARGARGSATGPCPRRARTRARGPRSSRGRSRACRRPTPHPAAARRAPRRNRTGTACRPTGTRPPLPITCSTRNSRPHRLHVPLIFTRSPSCRRTNRRPRAARRSARRAGPPARTGRRAGRTTRPRRTNARATRRACRSSRITIGPGRARARRAGRSRARTLPPLDAISSATTASGRSRSPIVAPCCPSGASRNESGLAEAPLEASDRDPHQVSCELGIGRHEQDPHAPHPTQPAASLVEPATGPRYRGRTDRREEDGRGRAPARWPWRSSSRRSR